MNKAEAYCVGFRLFLLGLTVSVFASHICSFFSVGDVFVEQQAFFSNRFALPGNKIPAIKSSFDIYSTFLH